MLQISTSIPINTSINKATLQWLLRIELPEVKLSIVR